MSNERTIAVVGLGYVGLPLAVAFSNKFRVIGFDNNVNKLKMFQSGKDVTNECGDKALKECTVQFTSDPLLLREANFIIVAVPTPVDNHNAPDLTPIRSACKIIGENLSQGSIVVFESTVYPGVTEEECAPILERYSGLKCGIDFKIGYSPERINPGDKVHSLTNILKIVSGMDKDALEEISYVYGTIIKAGIYKAPCIKVAEAAKVIENSQRDINIAFINELSKIFNLMGINTYEVLKAAETKWNFLQFKPGLVGGHCIGVDPYYLAYKAQDVGFVPEVILAGRRINDSMGKYVAENVVKLLIKTDCPINNAKVLIMGLTFKENINDIRNSRVVDIIRELKDYGVEVLVCDPHADATEVAKTYGIMLSDFTNITDVDGVILAVGHEEYKTLKIETIAQKFKEGRSVFADIKFVFDHEQAQGARLTYWTL